MLIFDGFPSRDRAEAFAKAVTERFGLGATVYDSQEESNKADPYPLALDPPIVLVERAKEEEPAQFLRKEQEVQEFVSSYEGSFEGT